MAANLNLHEAVTTLRKSVEALQQDLETKFTNFTNVEFEFGKMKKDQDDLRERVHLHRKDIDTLFESQNNVEQYSKNQDIEIKGIPKTANEDCKSLVKAIGEIVGFPIQDSDLDGCHRLRQPKNPNIAPSIVARFVRKECKYALMAKRKTKGPLYTTELGLPGKATQIYINDHLTAYNRQLLTRALDERKKGAIAAAWTFKGKIFVKKNEKDTPSQVKDYWSLEDITTKRNDR